MLRLGWQPLALWCADVEGAAAPVPGLLQQLEASGRQLVGEDAWEGVLSAGCGRPPPPPLPPPPSTKRRRPPPLPILLAALEQRAAAARRDTTAAGPLALAAAGVARRGGPAAGGHLDNLESLQFGPTTDAPDAFATWRDAGCAALWRGLRDLVRSRPGRRLAVLASTRYPNRDFGAVVLFHRLPDDALWRRRFPSLRRLSEPAGRGLSRGSPAIRAPSSSSKR